MYINDARNREPRGKELPVMKCPADARTKVKFSSANSTEGDNWARGNYAANASLAFYNSFQSSSCSSQASYNMYCGAGRNMPLSTSRWHRGVMGSNLSMSVSEIYDGTSNTILLAEVRAGLSRRDRRGTWALGDPGASSLWAHGSGEANGPNACGSGADDILDGAAGDGVTVDALRAECMSTGGCGNAQATARSCHAGGINATLADGSVRFVSNYIEKGTSGHWTISPNLTSGFLCWQRLCASQDGQVIDGKKF